MVEIALIVIVFALIGTLPTWPYSSQWGYYPSRLLSFMLIMLLIFSLTGGV
ncbi:DUF3309 family protein [Methylophilus sp. 5]|uniref:DUF3309 family protein n=1 Tax=Methylophilus sp. 5 TaxID=1112274 RepID=UPI0004B896AC|nr:DUF3309 family protein [Methylophilus sp. 5]